MLRWLAFLIVLIAAVPASAGHVHGMNVQSGQTAALGEIPAVAAWLSAVQEGPSSGISCAAGCPMASDHHGAVGHACDCLAFCAPALLPEAFVGALIATAAPSWPRPADPPARSLAPPTPPPRA
jgi:hypothetical protein